MIARHLAAPSPLMLAAEEIEALTCTVLLAVGAEIRVFDMGRHCEFPPMCVLESDSAGTFIRHDCGLGVERVAVLA
jgi:hypothetical protein